MRFTGNNAYKQLLLSVDALNTINGGVSEPIVNMEKGDHEYIISAKVPGVDPEKINVEINNDQLSIYYFHEFDHGEFGPTRLPYIIRRVKIPFDVNIKEIKARVIDGGLMISLPLNDMANGYHKQIDILH